jgi:hypothetical protein
MCFDCRLSFLGSKGWDKQFILIKPQAVPHAEMHLLKSFDGEGGERRRKGRGRAEISVAILSSTAPSAQDGSPE